MKRLFYLLTIVVLPIVAWVEIDRYRRLHAPGDYAYAIPDSLDWDYHDPELLLDFLQSAAHAEAYARGVWRQHKIDVLRPAPGNAEAQLHARTYAAHRAAAKALEQKLLRSARLKRQGWTQAQIRRWEADSTLETLELLANNPVLASLGQQSQLVFEAQRLLARQGYALPIDGNFQEVTRNAILEYQSDHQLYPSGLLDRYTLHHLLTSP
jgi:hypothetical protein